MPLISTTNLKDVENTRSQLITFSLLRLRTNLPLYENASLYAFRQVLSRNHGQSLQDNHKLQPKRFLVILWFLIVLLKNC
jgi:hypothetical protein